jgi:Tfp pilus assembly protein PilO
MNLINKSLIFSKKTTDYTFAVLFLLIFSMFIIFAIRPSLSTAFSLQKEEKDLIKVDKLYEDKIITIAQVQALIEENRNDLPLLYQAITTFPQVNKMFDDIKQAADSNSFIIKKANIGEVNLFESNKKSLQTIKVTIEGESKFEDFTKFSQSIFNQRRLKMIKNVKITNKNDMIASGSGQLKIQLDIDGYYL